MNQRADILIGMPSHDGKYTVQMMSALEAAVTKVASRGLTVMWDRTVGPDIAANRETSVFNARQAGAPWIMYVDSDTVIPSDAISRLMARDRDIVSGVYHSKHYPFVPIASRLVQKKGSTRDGDRLYQAITEWQDGAIMDDLDGVGGGCLLVKTKVFDKLTLPYFAFAPADLDADYARIMQAARLAIIALAGNPSKEQVVKATADLKVAQDACLAESENRFRIGEDYYFCRKAQQAGFKISLDAAVNCLHLGSHLYRKSDFDAAMEAEKARLSKEGSHDDPGTC